MNRTLVLASASPRRKSLLKMLDLDFQVHHADIDESIVESDTPDAYVARLARAKAEEVFNNLSRHYERPVVIGSDTTVVAEGLILGKPEDFEDACRMLSILSGVWHDVLTAVCVWDGARSEQVVVCSRVKFRPLSQQDMSWYWDTGEPADKAGAYGIQGHGGVFVERIDGSYSSIVGLPLCETATLLNKFEIKMGSMNHHE